MEVNKPSSSPRLQIGFSIIIFFFLLSFSTIAIAEEANVSISLINFLRKLDANSDNVVQSLRWNTSVDPCNVTMSENSWRNVLCNRRNQVQNIVLGNLNLTGTIDASLLCVAGGLTIVDLSGNKLTGTLDPGISGCGGLVRLYIGGNKLFGQLPDELGQLKNLKSLNISFNNFNGTIPVSLADISGLNSFLAQNNSLSGQIPKFDFSNLRNFNVSNNQLSGPIPDGWNYVGAAAFAGNSGLCGGPLNVTCPIIPAKKKPIVSIEKLAMFSGYIMLGITLILLVLCKIMFSKKKKKNKISSDLGVSSSYEEKKTVQSYSKTLDESELSAPAAVSSTSLVMLGTAPVISKDQLKFDELMRAPAELMGRGRFGSSYKVVVGEGNTVLMVKRIKSSFWGISTAEFKERMGQLETVRHRNVLPPVAFYASEQEKLAVYEYQQNGNLFKLLHGDSSNFNWPIRLRMAAGIASGLKFMHQRSSIPHGNLKSTNILISSTFDPLITEYGLISAAAESFSGDIYSYGVILLELLTGKLPAQNNKGKELVNWVQSVVREEWTAEVFDRKMVVGGGASEEGMMRLLRMAMRCVDASPENRPGMNRVLSEITAIVREEDEDTSVASDA